MKRYITYRIKNYTFNFYKYPLISYYLQARVMRDGRGISIKSALFDVIELLNNNYCDVNDFHRYLLSKIPPVKWSNYLKIKISNLFKTKDRSIGGWWDDFMQKQRHKSIERKLNKLRDELLSISTFELIEILNSQQSGKITRYLKVIK